MTDVTAMCHVAILRKQRDEARDTNKTLLGALRDITKSFGDILDSTVDVRSELDATHARHLRNAYIAIAEGDRK